MAWPTVPIAEVTDRIPETLSTAQLAVAEKRIGDAAAIVQYHLRTRGVLDAPTEEPWAAQFQQAYIQVVADMVIRLLQNPEGWVEQTEAIDDYRKTLRRAGDAAPTTLYLDETELARLLPVERRRRRSFSIHLGTS